MLQNRVIPGLCNGDYKTQHAGNAVPVTVRGAPTQQHIGTERSCCEPQPPYSIARTGSSCHLGRRHALATYGVAATVPALAALQPAWAAAAVGEALGEEITQARPEPDATITARVFLDIGISPTGFYKPGSERKLGDSSIVADDLEPAGRIVIGLYGNAAPGTVRNFLAALRAGVLNGSTASRVFPGEYIHFGRQGARRLGEVEVGPSILQANSDLYSSSSFRLTHSRPGTVSLSLSENDEEPSVRERAGYHPLEFLVTTGPGPVPRLDGQNVVFGRVLDGINTVIDVTAVPTFRPDARSRQLNQFAQFIGDGRAETVRRKYGRPFRAVVITASGVLEDTDGEGAKALVAGSLVDVP